MDGCIAGFADLQDSGYMDHFFVAGAFAGRGVEARQQVERSGVVLANARMGKVLAANCY